MSNRPHITDEEFRASTTNREGVYQHELKRAPIKETDEENRTFMDTLGRGRWPVDYITARMDGYPHADAMQVERVRIREAAGLPATEPMPPHPIPPVVPTPPIDPKPPTDQPGVKDDMQRFVDFYAGLCKKFNWAPDQTTSRNQRVMFLRDAVLGYNDPTIVMKRADPTRDISDEAVVFTRPGEDYRRFWDFIISGGSANWHLAVNGDGEILPPGQVLVDPKTLQIIEG